MGRSVLFTPCPSALGTPDTAAVLRSEGLAALGAAMLRLELLSEFLGHHGFTLGKGRTGGSFISLPSSFTSHLDGGLCLILRMYRV